MITVSFDCKNHNDVLLLTALWEIASFNNFRSGAVDDIQDSVVLDHYGFLVDTVLDFHGYVEDSELGEHLETVMGKGGLAALNTFKEMTR